MDTSTDKTLIELDRVAIGYRSLSLLSDISLSIRQGDFWGIVGPNGAGKTTLAKTIIGLLKPLGGRLLRPAGSLRFGYVPQRHTLNPDFPLRVLDVALMGRLLRLGPGHGARPEDRERTMAELERLGMAPYAELPFAALSGGEKQRVLLARALAGDPDIMILDEPTEGIDLAGEADILAFLRELHGQGEMSILMIAHHMGEVLNTVDHLCLVNRHLNLFQAGPVGDMVSEPRLSRLYGREVHIDECEEQAFVHVDGDRKHD